MRFIRELELRKIIKTFIERGCLELVTRNVIEVDYFKVMDVINNWLGGRQMTHLSSSIIF